MKVSNNDRFKLDLFSLIAFIAGATNKVTVSLAGEIFVSELILLASLPFLIGKETLVRALSNPVFRGFLIASGLTFLGYGISDLAAGSTPNQYLRGWARIIFVTVDLTALVLLATRNKTYLIWFLAGLGFGVIGYLLMTGTPLNDWKFGYGKPVIIALACIAYLTGFRAAIILLMLAGVISIYFDSRVHGASAMAVAGILWLRVSRPHKPLDGVALIGKSFLVSAIVITTLLMVLAVTHDEYANRREASNIGRGAGISVSLMAILDSPVVGYGSWTINEEYAEMVRAEVQEGLKDQQRRIGRSDMLRPHSQLLQAWVEGGLFGAAFFLYLGYGLVTGLYYIVLRRPLDVYTAPFAYFMVVGLWHLLMSPFGGGHRVFIASAAACLCVLALEVSISRKRPKNAKGLDSAVVEDKSTKTQTKQPRILRTRKNKVKGPMND